MKEIVTFGGGTGTFVVLRALRTIPDLSLTAIVSGADDGGSTGQLRDAYGFLPAGDVRQALVALSEDDTILRELFAYRFGKGNVSGHNLGNLFLTALTDILGSNKDAIEEASKILRIAGRVVCSTDTPATLIATLEDGTVIRGEHLIDERENTRSKITNLTYEQELPLSIGATEAVKDTSYIFVGPGDLYTSTIASLLALGTREAIQTSSAKIVYVLNLFTKAGQTTGLSAKDHVDTLSSYMGRRPDRVIVHNGSFEEVVLDLYASEGEYPVIDDLGEETSVIRADIASIAQVPAIEGDPVPRSLVRHDSEKLATVCKTVL
jgi:uncharacterized cofD-like protein